MIARTSIRTIPYQVSISIPDSECLQPYRVILSHIQAGRLIGGFMVRGAAGVIGFGARFSVWDAGMYGVYSIIGRRTCRWVKDKA